MSDFKTKYFYLYLRTNLESLSLYFAELNLESTIVRCVQVEVPFSYLEACV